jgi:hypothetical protein
MLPDWMVITVAALVIGFGLFRIKLAFRSAAEDARARERGGLFGYPRHTHALFGIVFILLGVLLLAGVFGLKLPWLPHAPPAGPAGG